MSPKLTWDQVGAWRMARHHLVERAPRAALLDVVADVCGLHAQLMSSAELAAWARVHDLEPDAVARALGEDRSLVKSWAMRGTLHLLRSSEYGLWLGGMSTYRHYLKPAWSKGFGISQDELKAMIAGVAKALDGEALTREELAAEVARITRNPDLADKLLGSWGSTLKPATYQGKLCFGPNRGRNVTFVRPDRWLKGKWTTTPGDEAMATITRRYLAANGPATRDDYARWWAMSPAEAAKHIKALGDEVAEVDVEGTPMWMLVADADVAGHDQAPRSRPPPPRLRPVRHCFHQAGRPPPPRQVPGAGLPPPGLDLARPPRRRPDGGRLEARAQVLPPVGHHRAVRRRPPKGEDGSDEGGGSSWVTSSRPSPRCPGPRSDSLVGPLPAEP